ncbi:MAG TPA: glutaredoxin 3 [Steroidobacteraceae bacterium]|nr:glutaredoxin 3 [Steroidobacteraceae bacterium]
MSRVTVYTTGWCPYCERALGLLARKGVQFDEIKVDEDMKLREEMHTRSGRRTVPQIFIDDRHIGGCEDLFALEGSGELDRLLQGVR